MSQSKQIQQTEPTLKEQVGRYTRYWPWFILTMLFAVIAAFTFLRYSTAIYESETTILIKDEQNSSLSELAAFQDLGLAGGLNSASFENEIQILKSKSLIERVVERLDLNIRYFKDGNVKDSELFDNKPFSVNILTPNNEISYPIKEFFVQLLPDESFAIFSENQEKANYKYGDIIKMPFGDIIINKELVDNNRFKENDTYRIKVQNLENLVISLRNTISVSRVSKFASVLKISLATPTPEKSEAILNALVILYNEDAVNDRNLVSNNTANFIEKRLAIITKELDSVESDKVIFKEDQNLTNIEAEGQLFIENLSEFNKKRAEVDTQIQLVNSVKSYMQSADTYALLPSNIGIKEVQLASLIENYNTLLLQRQKLLSSSTEANPVVQTLNSQVAELRNTITKNLTSLEQSLAIQSRKLNTQGGQINSEISEIPSLEKGLRDIIRQQEIKETLYLYLLQKREETAISLAVTTPKAKIIDTAYTKVAPVFPKKLLIYGISLVLGFIFPIGVIYGKDLFNTKVSNRKDITNVIPSFSIIGEIPRLKKGDSELVGVNDRSMLAEAFRILRTNLQYLFVNKPEGKKKIFVTSTIKGEGKTFVAFNLALTLALTGKKVVLVGADIRNPQLHRYIKNKTTSHKGLTEYIVDDSITANSLTIKSESYDNLDIILSGTIPPNPAELLMQDRTSQFFNELNDSYDYIIVDTAPSMLVTDTLLINKLADITLYVFRAGYTDKDLLEYCKDVTSQGKLTNVSGVLNNVDINNFGYGNKYGYSYTTDKIPWYKRFLS
ncbi:GumC family protein [Patiriisocius hiemis]|uniref:non-specific protein-tyrosine kinase n=1 Tax=Patiriisocius hiemis TaxID=3075604 RepID=A0ABU2YEP4_9FLAO|nr:polysaccharide biosynthesis tyrosine autokinase [Constantimarinum sp. W242]MDT0556651.1 polysaccharide biosynthesis tyrosine autokinase [Constantimarinum sp. W242]